MRVRHLQTYLADQKLIRQGKLSDLESFRLGIDAVYWSRTLPGLKDPLADALGGLPPSAFGVVDKELKLFSEHKITPIFVFQGIQPKSHQLFSSQLHQQMDEAWTLHASGERESAQQKFAQATSRVNSDLIFYLLHHMKSRGIDALQAPYFSTAQLAYLVEQGLFDAVYGPPSLLLYGVPKVITAVDFKAGRFEWVDLQQLLQTWNVTREQLIDACLLAGTEYCLTFPYLNLNQFHPGQTTFTFGTAIEFIKQAPLVSYMQHFPNEEMKNDHVDGYCRCRALVQHPVVLTTGNRLVCVDNSSSSSGAQQGPNGQPAGSPAAAAGPQGDAPPALRVAPVNSDFGTIVGARLPNALYTLIAKGVLSRKIPSVLATGEWTDHSHPTVDSQEYRDLLGDLRDYRRRAVGLVAMRLHEQFQKRPITFSRYTIPVNGQQLPPELVLEEPDCSPGMSWRFTAAQLKKEMQRVNCSNPNEVDIKFCLQWHAHEAENNGEFFRTLKSGQPISEPTDQGSLLAVTQFLLLENLSYFTEDGGMTVFGSALLGTPKEFLEPALLVLELMKVGCLTTEPLEACGDRPFPAFLNYSRKETVSPHERCKLLLSRVMSLVPMRLKNDMWNAEVDFDLAAYHSIVRMLKRSLRQLMEACLANVLLKDISKLKHLPKAHLDPKTPSKAALPAFMLPRNCLGIVCKFFLDRPAPMPAAQFKAELERAFPCCQAPLEDLMMAFRFWEEIARIVELLSETIDVAEVKTDMQSATHMLREQMRRLNFDDWKHLVSDGGSATPSGGRPPHQPHGHGRTAGRH